MVLLAMNVPSGTVSPRSSQSLCKCDKPCTSPSVPHISAWICILRELRFESLSWLSPPSIDPEGRQDDLDKRLGSERLQLVPSSLQHADIGSTQYREAAWSTYSFE